MNDQQPEAFRSRFGYHPCDVATYHKLKELHKWYWQAVRDFHRWWRWQRKLPANRRGSEPKPCLRFVRNVPWRKPRRSHGQESFRIYPMTLTDRGIRAWYAAARLPRASPMPPFAPCTLAAIDALHREVSTWNAFYGPRL
jgi:hypothetical protein